MDNLQTAWRHFETTPRSPTSSHTLSSYGEFDVNASWFAPASLGGRPAHQTTHQMLRPMLSMPTMQTTGELNSVRMSGPRTHRAPPSPTEGSVDFRGLNTMLEHMQMTIDQTLLRLNLLAEQQQHNDESMGRLQCALESSSNHLQALAMQHQVDELAMKNMQAVIEQNGSHVEVILDHSISEVRSSMRHRLQTMEEKQTASEEKLDLIMAAVKMLPRKGSLATAKSIERVQMAVDAQTASLIHPAEQQMVRLRAIHEDNRMTDMTERLKEKLDRLLAKQTSQHSDLMEKMERLLKTVRCEHDVAPPPRKVKRELAGYWYKRP